MSLADENPHDLAHTVSKAPRAAKARRLLFASYVVLLAAAVALSQRQKQQQGKLSLKADPPSVTLCPGQPTTVRLTAIHPSGVRIQLGYSWKVSGGDIKDKGDTAVWDLSGVQQGTYTVTVVASPLKPTTSASLSITAQASVTVKACREEAACPRISLSCPEAIHSTDWSGFFITWDGGSPGVSPKFVWRASGGQIIEGQGTPKITLRTYGLQESSVVVSVYLLGYGKPCVQKCTVPVQQASGQQPTVTPTQTITPTPTPTPTASPSSTATPEASPSPFVILNASPEASPMLSPSPSSTLGVQGSWGDKLWQISATIIALCVAAFLAAKMFFLGGASGSGSDLKDAKDEKGNASGSLEGGILGGLFGRRKKADKVQCTVFAPERAAQGDPFQVQVFAHLEKQAGELSALAAKADAEARDRGSHTLSEAVERGTKITFALKMDGLKVGGRKKSLVWDGAINFVQFAVDVPEDFLPEGVSEKQVRGEVKIYYGEENAPVGEIMFLFKVVREGATGHAAATTPTRPEQRHHVYEYAFVSYCSDDLEKVLLGLRGMLKRWDDEGIEYFFDRRNLKRGEPWRTAIGKHLDRCDLFVLFWSKAAQGSEEVGREISYAVARKGGSDDRPPAFDPFTIEKPIPKPLPKGLELYHFGDELFDYMKDGGVQ